MKFKNRILFYSSVKDVKLFEITGFYREDINALEMAGYQVILSNNFFDFFKFYNYDFAFLYFYTKSVFCGFIAKLFCKKIFFTGGIDNLSMFPNNKTFRILFKFGYLISTKCNIVSNSDMIMVKNILSTFPNLDSNKLELFPHAINDVKIKKFTNELNKDNIISTICWMGSESNVKRKGLDTTISYFSVIQKNHPEFKLIIIGTIGVGKKYIDSLIKLYSLQNNIIFTDQISDDVKFKLLSKSKYYFQLSKYEGFGIAALEALALNNYVFHTNVGGLKDTIDDHGEIISLNLDQQNFLKQFEYVEKNYNSLIAKEKLTSNYILTKYSLSNRSISFKNLIN